MSTQELNKRIMRRVAKELTSKVGWKRANRAASLSGFCRTYRKVHLDPSVAHIMCHCILPCMLKTIQDCIGNEYVLVDAINTYVREDKRIIIKGSFFYELTAKQKDGDLSFGDIFECAEKSIINHYYREFNYTIFNSLEHIRVLLNQALMQMKPQNPCLDHILFVTNRIRGLGLKQMYVVGVIPPIESIFKKTSLSDILRWQTKK